MLLSICPQRLDFRAGKDFLQLGPFQWKDLVTASKSSLRDRSYESVKNVKCHQAKRVARVMR